MVEKKKRSRIYGTVEVDVDIQDIIDQLDDDDILELADSIRGGGEDSFEASRTAVLDAINQIRRGAYSDAITTLERQFLPKWQDKAQCEAAYREAVA